MASKTLFALASALFVQSALSTCLGRAGLGLAYDGLAYDKLGAQNGRVGCGAISPVAELGASYGGGLSVSSSSAMPPTGLAVESENAYEGCVAVAGNLPYLGIAHVEGVFPTAGAGVIKYGCGDGVVAITAEGPVDAALAPMALAPGIASATIPSIGLGYKGIGLERGCGCGCKML